MTEVIVNHVRDDSSVTVSRKLSKPRYCRVEGCDKRARKGGRCVGHGGGTRCRAEGCNKGARSGSEYCCSHGGGPRCQVKGCHNGALRNGRCRAHGSRCQVEGCNNGSVSGGRCNVHLRNLVCTCVHVCVRHLCGGR